MKLSIAMTRRETIQGWIFLLISVFALPTVIFHAVALLKLPLSEAELNILYFFVDFIVTLILFRRFLMASCKKMLASIWRTLRFAALGFLMYYGAMILLSHIIIWILPDFSNVNDAAINELSQEHYSLMALCTVFLVPVTEETLYRGLLFQSFQRKNRLFAYGLSTAVFAGIHVFGYIGLYDWLTLLLCFVQYLPAGIALAWAYEKADTIFAPILIHLTINQIGMSAMR